MLFFSAIKEAIFSCNAAILSSSVRILSLVGGSNDCNSCLFSCIVSVRRVCSIFILFFIASIVTNIDFKLSMS